MNPPSQVKDTVVLASSLPSPTATGSTADEMIHIDVAADVIRIGVVGYGFWGPNVVRNLHGLEGARLVAVCDKSPAALRRVRHTYPGVSVCSDSQDILASTHIDAVAIVTPVWSHYELAKAALENGKHVFIEKPFTSTVAQAEELIELAATRNLTIMVDHTFLFTGAVRKIRELVDDGTLGSLFYYDSTRLNLGLFQHDINVIWDLAPHDLSIVDYLIQEKPEAIVATGEKHLNGHVDVAYLTIYFPGNIIAHINVSWLCPVKVRTTLIGGGKKMLVWNDLEADGKIKVYDKGADLNHHAGRHERPVSYRSGDMWAPKLEPTEALRVELAYFVECIVNSNRPFNDGVAGLRVLKMLEATEKSLQERGKTIYL